MKPYYQDNHTTLYNMNFMENDLPDESVQMVVTSPPYWGLRKYSGEQELIWGGDKDCEHQWGDGINRAGYRSSDNNEGTKQSTNVGAIGRDEPALSNICSLCGAWKGAYGLEPTPEMYIEHTIEILREIRRVLRKDGVVFWNIGDSYQGGNRGASAESEIRRGDQGGSFQPHNIGAKGIVSPSRLSPPTIKPKDLCLIPFRVAIAAQEDGWWVRSVIIWSKPNPMPESVKDRPTESHEYILMLTKSKRYYWDADAVREERQGNTHSRGKKRTPPIESAGIGHEDWCKYMTKDEELVSRNIRSVWEFPTQPYPEAHFAVFPEKLPEICIKAATPEVGCCSKCGSPWERILDKKPSAFNIRVRDAKAGRATPEEGYKATQEEIDNYQGNHPDPGYRQTTGWQPTCKCNTDKVPSIVLDPFAGAGSSLWVAKKLNRYAVGYEISAEYCQLGADRCQQQVLM